MFNGYDKVNLGSGSMCLEGFLNIDYPIGHLDGIKPKKISDNVTYRTPDLYMNIADLNGIPDNSFDYVRASHTLEHFCISQTRTVLKEWVRILDNGGIIDIVVPDITMLATAHGAIAAGSKIITADVDENFMMKNSKLELIDSNATFIPVAYNGKKYSCEELRITFPNSLIIVDAAQSILTSGVVDELADFCVFSLGAIKNITSGIGGIIATKNKRLYELMSSYRDHGRIDRGVGEKTGHDHSSIGVNMKMSDMNAALAISQLSRAKQISDSMNNLLDCYKKHLPNFEFIKRSREEIPWLIECKSEQINNANGLRKMYKRLSGEPSLKDYIIEKYVTHKKYEFNEWYYLPSTFNITEQEVIEITNDITKNIN